jgi:proteasome lid subunit RPN8/RPN11
MGTGILRRLRTLIGGTAKEPYREVSAPPPRQLVITDASIRAARDCIAIEITEGHEGVTYLLGQTNGDSTLVVAAIRPECQTTPSSFNVSSAAMARVVRKAANVGLEVVGQIHSHPRKAFHTAGDEDGARIAYDGYVSIVVPDYGRRLPSLRGAAVYFYRNGTFAELNAGSVKVISGRF